MFPDYHHSGIDICALAKRESESKEHWEYQEETFKSRIDYYNLQK